VADPSEHAPPALDLAAPKDGPPLNIAEAPAAGQEVPARRIGQYTPQWAKIVRPIARGLLTLLAAVMLLPFLMIALFGGTGVEDEPVKQALDWAKTILPPLIGFGGAIVGYYFGTRGDESGTVGDDDSGAAED